MKTICLRLSLFLIVALLAHCGGGGGGDNNNNPISGPTPTSPSSSDGEGSPSEPVSLGVVSSSLTHTYSVGAGKSSYYSFTTGSSSEPYTISLTNIQSDLKWDLFPPGSNFSGLSFSCHINPVGGNQICISDPLDPNATYLLEVSNIGGAASTYTLTIAAPATPQAPPLAYNFDDGTLQGWLATGTWGVTNAAGYSNSPSYSVTDSPAGNYTSNACAYLISPVIDLTGTTTPKLTFYHRYEFGPSSLDYGTVEISDDGGVSFWEVKQYKGTQSTFTLATVDLNALIPVPLSKTNQMVIKFTLWSDNIDMFDGWYIDDIAITN